MPASDESLSFGKRLEHGFESLLFASRWLLAPFYLGMTVALLLLLVVFARELVADILHLRSLNAEGVILLSLSLIDLSLTGNLLMIVILAGYENFVSRMHVGNHEDRPTWMGTVDFADLKIKVIASISAISAIALLRAFLPLSDPENIVDPKRLGWMVAVHLTFVISGVLLALMDFISSKAEPH